VSGAVGPLPVSVLVPTLDEERNLADCLESLSFSDDVVVVDSHSRDRTGDVAREAGARVVAFTWDGRGQKKKAWALGRLEWKHDWLLVVDADERATPELAEGIRDAVSRGEHAGFLVSRRLRFMGRWIRHCGYYPGWTLRLFRRDRARYERLVDGDTLSGDNEIHEHVLVDGSIGRLRGDLLHYAYPDVATFVEKHNRYSSWEAAVEVRGARSETHPAGGALRRRTREITRRMPFRPTLRFLYSYVLRGGFRDGYPGFALCRLLASYELLSVLKARELRTRRDSSPS